MDVPSPPPLWTDQFATDVTKLIQDGINSMITSQQEEAASTTFMNDLTPQDIVRGKGLGSGAFSNVTKVTIRRNNKNTKNQYYACKSLKRDMLPQVLPVTGDGALVAEGVAGFIQAAKELSREAYHLSNFDHPHIIAIAGWSAGGVASYEHYKRHDAFFLLLELLHEDTLEDRIERWNQEDDPAAMMNMNRRRRSKSHTCERKIEQLTICGQIANALEYIHSNKIVYRDLKPQNIGFAKKSNEKKKTNTATTVQVKLMDFGLARQLPSSTTSHTTMLTIPPFDDEKNEQQHHQHDQSNSKELFNMTGMVGTMRYMSPEVCRHQPYNTKADIYSWSIVSYEVLSQSMPFDTMSPEEYQTIVCQQGVRPNLWNEQQPRQQQHPPLSSEYLVLLANAWRTDPAKRLSLNHIQQQIDLFLQKETLMFEAEQLLSNMPETHYALNRSNSMNMPPNPFHVSTTTSMTDIDQRQQQRRLHQHQLLQNDHHRDCYNRSGSKRRLDVCDDDDDGVAGMNTNHQNATWSPSTATMTTTTNHHLHGGRRRSMEPSTKHCNHEAVLHDALKVLSNDPVVNMNSFLPSNHHHHHYCNSNFGGNTNSNRFHQQLQQQQYQHQLILQQQQQRVTNHLRFNGQSPSPGMGGGGKNENNNTNTNGHAYNTNYRRTISMGEVDTASSFPY